MSVSGTVTYEIWGLILASLYVLDVGLGTEASSLAAATINGKILQLDPATGTPTTIVTGQNLPDGINISETKAACFGLTWAGVCHSVMDQSCQARWMVPTYAIWFPRGKYTPRNSWSSSSS